MIIPVIIIQITVSNRGDESGQYGTVWHGIIRTVWYGTVEEWIKRVRFVITPKTHVTA